MDTDNLDSGDNKETQHMEDDITEHGMENCLIMRMDLLETWFMKAMEKMKDFLMKILKAILKTMRWSD